MRKSIEETSKDKNLTGFFASIDPYSKKSKKIILQQADNAAAWMPCFRFPKYFNIDTHATK